MSIDALSIDFEWHQVMYVVFSYQFTASQEGRRER